MVGEEQGAAEKVNEALNVSVSGDEAAAIWKLVSETDERQSLR